MLTWLIPPIIGGVIGYITNAVAIKMLFRPRKAIYLFGKKLPFTPGLIPREQARVAKSVGSVISTQLLNTETISEVLSSKETTTKIRAAVKGFVEKNKSNTDTVRDILSRFMTEGEISDLNGGMRREAVNFIYNKLTSDKARIAISDGIAAFIERKLPAPFINLISEPAAKAIGFAVNKALKEDGRNVIDKVLDDEIDKIEDLRVCDLMNVSQDKMTRIADFVLTIYSRTVRDHLSDIMEGIDIAGIVENKIASFDVAQLEDMIFGIMKRELSAIVYLGALLGFIMGFVNLIVRF